MAENSNSEPVKKDNNALRQLILAVQRNTTLTPREKARKIQDLMTASYRASAQDSSHGNAQKPPSVSMRDDGEMGCSHYYRGCMIKANCCGSFYPCRFCHDADQDHKIDRYATKEMFCFYCKRTGPIAKECVHCKQVLASYYCPTCKFHDNTPGKNIYHCDQCGLCRVGKGLGIDFKHCNSCGTCIDISIFYNHKCIERNMKSNCPVCTEFLFTSVKPVSILNCGHMMHVHCLKEYQRVNYTCPICNKSMCDMSSQWVQQEFLIKMHQMPEEFADTTVCIMCNDCNVKATVPYHFVGHKCAKCGGFNTRVLERFNMPPPEVFMGSVQQFNQDVHNGGTPGMLMDLEPDVDEEDESDEDEFEAMIDEDE